MVLWRLIRAEQKGADDVTNGRSGVTHGDTCIVSGLVRAQGDDVSLSDFFVCPEVEFR